MKNEPATSKPLVSETRRPVPRLSLVTTPANNESALWTAPPNEDGPPTTSDVLHVPMGSIPHEIETKILQVLCRPHDPSESHTQSGAKREVELRALFAKLDVTPAFHLRRRLETIRADDALSSSFQRLVIDRRQRLLRFLGDARRRVAIGI